MGDVVEGAAEGTAFQDGGGKKEAQRLSHAGWAASLTGIQEKSGGVEGLEGTVSDLG